MVDLGIGTNKPLTDTGYQILRTLIGIESSVLPGHFRRGIETESDLLRGAQCHTLNAACDRIFISFGAEIIGRDRTIE